MKDEIIQLLKQSGLSPSESQIYLSLIDGSKTVKDLSLYLRMARTTIVEGLLFLEKYNLISSRRYENTRRKIYSIGSKESLVFFIETKISNIEKTRVSLAESKAKLLKFYEILNLGAPGFDQRIDIYLGKKEIIGLYRSTIVEESINSICNLDDYYKIFPSGLSLQPQANRQLKTRHFRDLIIEGTSVGDLIKNRKILDYSNYEFKIIPMVDEIRSLNFTDIMICSTHAIFSNFTNEIPYSVKLTSIEITNFLRSFHTILWNTLSSIETKQSD